jgi:hypothetical protein
MASFLQAITNRETTQATKLEARTIANDARLASIATQGQFELDSLNSKLAAQSEASAEKLATRQSTNAIQRALERELLDALIDYQEGATQAKVFARLDAIARKYANELGLIGLENVDALIAQANVQAARLVALQDEGNASVVRMTLLNETELAADEQIVQDKLAAQTLELTAQIDAAEMDVNARMYAFKRNTDANTYNRLTTQEVNAELSLFKARAKATIDAWELYTRLKIQQEDKHADVDIAVTNYEQTTVSHEFIVS